MKLREHLERLRAHLRQMVKYSIYDAAKFNSLAIEPWKDMGPKYDGHLDTMGDQPRFIGINPDLPPRYQIYVIAREIARLKQQQLVNSIILDKPLKWDLLASAPVKTQEYIYRLDLEVRAYWMMHWHVCKADFFGFYNEYWGKCALVSHAPQAAEFIFFKLRVRRFLLGIYSAIRGLKSRAADVLFYN